MTIALLFFVALSITLSIALIRLHNKHIQIETLNLEVKSQNTIAEQTQASLTQEIENKRKELDGVKADIETQNNIVQSLTQTAEMLRQKAESQAEESYKARVSALELQYEEKSRKLEKQLRDSLDDISKQVANEEKKLATLEDKQLAYIQAQQRQLEMQFKRDFYRLEVSDDDKSDITLLRDMQSRFVRKEAIDKLIWEVYFKKPYDALISRLSLDSSKKCGIYKITNLTTNQDYIGQSVDIKERFRTHIKTALSSAPASNKLYQTMKKYGPEDFTFEVLEEVPRDKLNEREIYWIDFYKTREFGLNGTKGGS